MAVDRIEARRRLVLKKRAGITDADKARRMVAREIGCEPDDLLGINYALLVTSSWDVPGHYEQETSTGTGGITLPEQSSWTGSADTPTPDVPSTTSE